MFAKVNLTSSPYFINVPDTVNGYFYYTYFEWKNYAEVTQNNFQISNDLNFNSIIINLFTADLFFINIYLLSNHLSPGNRYYFRVKGMMESIETNWSQVKSFWYVNTTDVKDDHDDMLEGYHLYQNYPNPFNPNTEIKYSVLNSSRVEVKVFDVLGNEIETLVNEEKPAGSYELTWNAANLPSGIYFYRLQAGDFVQTKKMILLK